MKTTNKLIPFVLKSHLEGYNHCGWGNGYVALPKGHPCFGMDYDAIHSKYQIEVHYGLTWARLQNAEGLRNAPEEVKDMWVVGFDTAHLGDSLENWPTESSVMFEAMRLKEQLENLIENES